MVRDAERLPWRRVGAEAVRPRRPRVWVRLDGVWCRGAIVFWQRDAGGWVAWVQHEIPHSATDWTEHHWVRYDPETVQPRDGDVAPG